MLIKFTNNAKSRLAAGVSAAATTIVVVASEGGKFPSLGAGEFFYLTLEEYLPADAENPLREIVKCTARSGDSMTIVRAQDGTTARSWALADKVELRVVAAALVAMDYTPTTDSLAAAKVSKSGDTMTGDLVITNTGEGGELRLRETASNKYATIDIIAASNMARVWHGMAGPLRTWEFRGDGIFSSRGFYANTGDSGYFFGSDGDTGMSNPSDGNLRLNVNGVDFMTLASSGYIYANRTIYLGNVANLQLTPRSGWADASCAIRMTDSLGTSEIYSRHSPGAWVGVMIDTPQAAGYRFDGGGFTSPQNITAYSDGRLKTEWATPLPDFVERLAKLKAGSYRRTDSVIGLRQAGVEAQAVQELLPEAVTSMGDNAFGEGDHTLGLNYGGFSAVAVVMLAREVMALRAELSKLKARVL